MDNGLKWFGGITTALYLAAGGWYIFSRWAVMSRLDPNALGDFLAGAFSPLAFLWLVLGFYQQGKELGLQVAEMKESVKQQAALVAVSTKQLETELEVIATERARVFKSLLPIIKATARATHGGQEGTKYSFTFKNIGYDAEDFKAEIELPRLKDVLISIPVLHKAGETAAVGFSIPDITAPIYLHISFINGHNEVQTVSMKATVVLRDNHLPALVFS